MENGYIKCDRCGFVFDGGTNVRNLALIVDGTGAKSFQLCPKCLDRCKKWLNNEYPPKMQNPYEKQRKYYNFDK